MLILEKNHLCELYLINFPTESTKSKNLDFFVFKNPLLIMAAVIARSNTRLRPLWKQCQKSTNQGGSMYLIDGRALDDIVEQFWFLDLENVFWLDHLIVWQKVEFCAYVAEEIRFCADQNYRTSWIVFADFGVPFVLSKAQYWRNCWWKERGSATLVENMSQGLKDL